MQPVDRDGNEGMIEPFDEERLEAILKDDNIKYVKVFRLKPGMRLEIPDIGTFKVTRVRPNGKITMRMEAK
jgi:hypothetical protein